MVTCPEAGPKKIWVCGRVEGEVALDIESPHTIQLVTVESVSASCNLLPCSREPGWLAVTHLSCVLECVLQVRSDNCNARTLSTCIASPRDCRDGNTCHRTRDIEFLPAWFKEWFCLAGAGVCMCSM